MVLNKSGLILFFLVVLSASFVLSANITGKVVSGNVISSPITLGITVVSTTPSLSIDSPQNATYITNESINLSYSVANDDTVWYNLDGSSNITITGSVLFNVTQGGHTLYLYANNSGGNLSSANVTFNANSSKFTVLYDDYKGGNKGDSTGFKQKSYENLQNMTGITLENNLFGKIIFGEYINITDDLDPLDGAVDLDGNIEISSNLVSINSTALPNFNVSSTLSLYGLNFTDPRVLLDGSVCPDSICTEISYSSGILIFSVTHFSNYSAGETPSSSSSPTNSGGSSSSSQKGTFKLDVNDLVVSLKTGVVVTKTIEVTNLDNRKRSFNIESENLGNSVRVSPTSFSLRPEESQKISIDFIAREGQVPELYLGKLIFKSEKDFKEVLVSLEVESKKALFDVDVDVLHENHQIILGEKLNVEIKLFNMGDTGRIDAEVGYFLKDIDGNIIIYHEDTRAIETNLEYIENLDLPSDISPGKYIFYVKVRYDGKIAIASIWISIIEEPRGVGEFFWDQINVILSSLVIVLLIIVGVILLFWKNRK